MPLAVFIITMIMQAAIVTMIVPLSYMFETGVLTMVMT